MRGTVVELTQIQTDIRDTVRSFATRDLLPREAAILKREREGGPGRLTADESQELQQLAKKSGLWGIDTPEEYGGADLPSTTIALVIEELGHSIFDFRFGGSAPDILYQATPDQQAEYLVPTIAGDRRFCLALTEASSGSDARNISTSAVRRGSDWVVTGEKMWISYAGDADYAIVFANTVDDGGAKGVTAFLIDRDMGWTAELIEVMGSHVPYTLYLDEVVVPGSHVLGAVNRGFSLVMSTLNRSRTVVLPSRNVGASVRLLGMAVDYAKQRTTFGKTLAERENIQWMLAESDIEIRAARALTMDAAQLVDAGLDSRYAASAAKYFAAQTSNRVVDRVMQIHGAVGYAKGTVIERFYRDLRVERIYLGSDEMQLSTVARGLLGGQSTAGGA